MTDLWTAAVIAGGLLYLFVAARVAYRVYDADAALWGGGSKANAHSFDVGLAACFGMAIGLSWPLLAVAVLMAFLILKLGDALKRLNEKSAATGEGGGA